MYFLEPLQILLFWEFIHLTKLSKILLHHGFQRSRNNIQRNGWNPLCTIQFITLPNYAFCVQLIIHFLILEAAFFKNITQPPVLFEYFSRPTPTGFRFFLPHASPRHHWSSLGLPGSSLGVSRVIVGAFRIITGVSRAIAGAFRVSPGASRVIYVVSRIISGTFRVIPGASRFNPGLQRSSWVNWVILRASQAIHRASQIIPGLPGSSLGLTKSSLGLRRSKHSQKVSLRGIS